MQKPPCLNEILSRDPVTVFAGTLLSEAIVLMKMENVTAIVVVEAKRPIGILTERDVLRTLASGESPDMWLVMSICSPNTGQSNGSQVA